MRKIRLSKRIIVLMLLISVVLSSVIAGAKTKTVKLNEGEFYRLPKKACNIVVKNKKVVKLIKKRKLKACKTGSCKVTYSKKGKNYKVKIVVIKDKNKNKVPAATNVPVNVPSTTVNDNEPTATPWGNYIPCNIYELVVTNIEKGSNDNESIVYCDNCADEYECIGTKNFAYKINTSKLICTVPAQEAQNIKIGDFVKVGFNAYNNKVEVKDDVSVITGISIVYECKANKKTDITTK